MTEPRFYHWLVSRVGPLAGYMVVFGLGLALGGFPLGGGIWLMAGGVWGMVAGLHDLRHGPLR